MAHQALTPRDATILAIESRPWPNAGTKEQHIMDELGLSATRYYQALVRLLDNPAAWEAEPIVMRRVRDRAGRRADSGAAHRKRLPLQRRPVIMLLGRGDLPVPEHVGHGALVETLGR